MQFTSISEDWICTLKASKNRLPTHKSEEPFLKEDIREVMDVYSKIMAWSKSHSNYSDQARAKFAESADGWLVAFAHVHNTIVVTNEKSAPHSTKSVKHPDVCQEFGVQQRDAFAMLRSLGVRFD